jgi:anti-sigma factor RsiW
MTCDRVRDRLQGYDEGTLDRAERAQVAGHLAECPDCQADLDALTRLGPALAALPRRIEPPADLWRGIAPRLRRAGGARRVMVPVWALVAAALVLVAGSAALTVTLTRPEAPEAAPNAFSAAEARYMQAAVQLSTLYSRRRDSLSPQTRVVLERNLATIEKALGEARDALDRDPANPALEAVVLAAYRQKVDFLQRASSLDQGG